MKLADYRQQLINAFESVDQNTVDVFVNLLAEAYHKRCSVFVCGNGGSATISEHFTCDHSKGICTATNNTMFPRVVSLSSNIALITAIANDFAYEDIFSKQLEYLAVPGDVLVAISSSGNSPNIVNALRKAKELKMLTCSIVGFDGGVAKKQSDLWVHINSNNYGIVEDVTQSIMHYTAAILPSKVQSF